MSKRSRILDILLICLIFSCSFLTLQSQSDDLCDRIAKEPLELLIPEETLVPGQSICFPLSVRHFVNIVSVDFNILFDSDILRYDNVNVFVGDGFVNDTEASTGKIKYLSIVTGDPITIPDDTQLFELCFTVIGDEGDGSNLVFADLEFLQRFNYRECNQDDLTELLNSADACNETINYTTCVSSEDVDNGELNFFLCGSDGPYRVELLDLNGASYGTRNGVNELSLGQFSNLPHLGPKSTNYYTLNITDNAGNVTQYAAADGNGIFIGLDIQDCKQDEDEIEVDIPPTNVMCSSLQVTARPCGPAAGTNGSISINICGGTGPYSYSIIGTAVGSTINEDRNNLEDFTEYFIEGLPTDTYMLTIEDSNGGSIVENIALAANLSDPLSVILNPIDPVCEEFRFASSAGSITAVTSGGSGMYKYSWSNNPQNIDRIAGLTDGMYSVTVTDTNTGCKIEEDVSLNYDPIIPDVIVTPALCDSKFGNVEISATGGRTSSGRYRFEIDGTFGGSGASISPTFAGEDLLREIRFTIQDDSGDEACHVDTSLVIGVQSSIEIGTSLVSGCGSSSGVIKAQMQSDGNIAPNILYELRNSAGVLIQGPIMVASTDSVTFDNFDPDTYVIVATEDGNGCSAESEEVTFVPSSDLTITPNITEPGCDTGDPLGTIELNVLGGDGNYIFNWLDVADNVDTRTDLQPDTYFVTVTDGSGCRGTSGMDGYILGASNSTISFNLPNRVAPVDEIQCAGANDGALKVEISEPADRVIEWYKDGALLPGENGEILAGLGPGEYRFRAIPTTGCPIDTVFTLTDPDPIDLFIDQPDPACPESTEVDLLTASDLSGRTNLLIRWQDTLTKTFLNDGFTQSNVPVGTYLVSASDPNSNCPSEDTIFTVEQYPDFNVRIINQINNVCFSDSNGLVEVAVTGGSGAGDINYIWSDDPDNPGPAIPNQNTFQDLATGSYTLQVFDNICLSQIVPFEITGAEEIKIDLAGTDITSPSCYGDQDGFVELAINGISGSINRIRMEDVVTGAIYPSFNSTVPNLPAGEFSVRMFDTEGCNGIDTILIQEPDSFSIEIDLNNIQTLSCNSDDTGILRLINSGGNPGQVNYSWERNGILDGSLNGPNATNLVAGEYTAYAEDTRGCRDSTTYMMEPNVPIELEFTSLDSVQCFGDRMFFGNLSPTGGTNTGFRFSLGGELLPVADSTELSAGTYSLEIRDQDGCVLDTTFTIMEPPEVVVELGPDVEIELGDTYVLTAEHDPAEDIVSYEWFTGEGSFCMDCPSVSVAPETDTVYDVYIENSDGCSDDDEVTIRVRRTRNVFLPNVINTANSNTNSSFKLFTGQGVERIEYLQIFDRFGNKVHSVEQLSGSALGTADWDARLNGTLVESGVYVFMARVLFTDGEFLDYRGDITVIH